MIEIIEKFSFPIILCTPIVFVVHEIDNERAGKEKKEKRVFYLKWISSLIFPLNVPPSLYHLLFPLLSTRKCKGNTKMYHFLIIKRIFFVSLRSCFSLLNIFTPARKWNKSKIVSLHLLFRRLARIKMKGGKAFSTLARLLFYIRLNCSFRRQSRATSRRMNYAVNKRWKK